MEEWRDTEYKNYQVSNLGNVRKQIFNGFKYVKGQVNHRGKGYLATKITVGERRKYAYFHILVALAFIGVRPDGMVIDHIDRNSFNNRVENLRYCSVSDNMKNSSRYVVERTEKLDKSVIRTRLWKESKKKIPINIIE